MSDDCRIARPGDWPFSQANVCAGAEGFWA